MVAPNTGKAHRLSDTINELSADGIPYLVGAYQGGLSIQAKTITTTADTPGHEFVFATYGLSDMADANYLVFVQNITDNVDPTGPEPTTYTTTGFRIVGHVTGDRCHVLIIGRIAGQAAQ